MINRKHLKTLEKKSLNIDVETHRAIKQFAAGAGKEMYEIIAEAWQVFANSGLDQSMKSQEKETAEGFGKHQHWHDQLEVVLNDSEEAVGIQKNLEWAEKAVLAKTPPRKQRAG